MIDQRLVSTAAEAAAVVAPLARRIEADRRLPPEAVAALVRARVFKLFVPRAFGGEDADPATMVAVLERIATGDGSAGWCAMIAATSSLMSLYLDEPVAREVFGPEDATTCGVFAPMGRSAPTPDGKGYRVSGRWAFASGCEHAKWRMGGTLVASDPPELRSVLFRAEETTIHDTWDTSGLRGTGSHDFEVRDVVVPRERTFSFLRDAPKHTDRVLPFFGVLAAGVAAVGLGIARAATDAFVDHARSKSPQGSKRKLAERETIQLDVARAEARLGAARAFLLEAIDAATAREADLAARARLRLAACHAAKESAAVTADLHHAAGGSVVYSSHPLQRHFRDSHVVTQHLMVGVAAETMAARVLLGLETDTAML